MNSGPQSSAKIPTHIKPEIVVDYDMFGDRRFDETGDLHLGLQKLADEAGRGIFWTPHNGGHWLINDHELLFQAARDTALFSSNNRSSSEGAIITIPPMEGGAEPRFAPLSLDPPEHGTFRAPLLKVFGPSAIGRQEQVVRDLARPLIARLKSQNRAEFLDAIAEPLPVTVFLKMMGMPLGRLAEFRSWMSDMASKDNARRASSFANIEQAMGELIAERQVQRRDDLVSTLLDSDVGGHNPTLADMQSYCLLLFTAGLDTLVNTFSYAMYHLARNPDLQDHIRKDPGSIPEFIEEVLRRYAVVMVPRIVARDAEFAGVCLKQGERVLLMLPSGNLDPNVFLDPLAFDFDRENKAHMTFNSGPHRCVGSHLARLELRVFFEEWFAEMPNIELDPQDPPTYRSGFNLAISKLPLIWQASA